MLYKRTINDIEELDPPVAECSTLAIQIFHEVHSTSWKNLRKDYPILEFGVKYHVGSLLQTYYRGYTLKKIAKSEAGGEGREVPLRNWLIITQPQSNSTSH